ncbi:MAG: hypothetical protein AAFQ94_02415 [Bacteroidota bacterium]
MKYLLIICLLLVASIFSCDEGEIACSDLLIEVGQIETENECMILNVDLQDNYVVIRNQTDFAAVVNATCQTAIDFSEFDLLIGRIGLSNGLTSIEYEHTRPCDTNIPQLDIIFNLNETTVAPDVVYNALIPKLRDNESLTVNLISN